MADRGMSVVPVSISILVSFMSAILILGTPAEMYTAGTEYFVILAGISLAILVSALVFVPLLYPLKLTSSFEYLERRFKSRAVKVTGTLITIVQLILLMGVSAFAPATALETVTGFPEWATIVIVGPVSTFYTTLGGMKAVVATDVFQSVFMLAGILAIAVEGVIRVGSLGTAWQISQDWDRIKFLDFDPDPRKRHSLWSLVVGATVGWTAMYGCNQASVQRYSALTSLTKAKIAVLLNAVGAWVFLTVACLAGVIMFAYYVQQGCDPLLSGRVANPNQLIPYFVMEVLNYPGVPGLFISSLFSGALSTMSSCLNALAAITWEDFFKPFLGNKLTEPQKTWVTRLLVLVFGGAGIGMAFMAQGLGGTILQAALSFTGAATGPVLGLFLLGGLFPWANAYGAVVGGVLGLVFPLWISIGAYSLPRGTYPLPFPTNGCSLVTPIPTPTTPAFLTTTLTATSALSTAVLPQELTGISQLYTVSYLWYPSIGVAVVIIVGLVVSVITGPMKMEEVDPKYLIPLFDRLFCCLPASWRRTLRCHRDFPRSQDIIVDGDVMESDVLLEADKPAQRDVTKVPIYTLAKEKVSPPSLESGLESDVINDELTEHDVRNSTDSNTTRL